MLCVDQRCVDTIRGKRQARASGSRQRHVTCMERPEHERFGDGPRSGHEVAIRERAARAGLEKVRGEGESGGVGWLPHGVAVGKRERVSVGSCEAAPHRISASDSHQRYVAFASRRRRAGARGCSVACNRRADMR
eukprot:6212555-Pleurochrysis_carterae.AAC.3